MGLFSAKETMNLGPAGTVDVPKKPDEWVKLNGILATKMLSVMPTEQDHWWFTMEQYDRSRAFRDPAKSVMRQTPLKLHEIEYEGRRSENSYVGAPNPAVAFLQGVQAALDKRFNIDLAEITVAYTYISYATACLGPVNRIRLKYAVHFHNNCVETNSFRYADEWDAVIRSLGGE